ncbi:MAG: cell division protein ZipA C-terminal FtsZ-binding domain-containing protein [Gallionella sp.]
MSELQTALLLIGVGVMVVVYGYGWWQQRRLSRKFGAAFKANHADALYQADEQTLAPPLKPEAKQAMDITLTHEFIRDTEGLPDEHVLEQAAAPSHVLDESCALLGASSDFIIALHLREPSSCAVLDGFWQRKFDFGKPVQVCGLTLNGERWERAIAESQTLYTRFRIAVQLVDRSGVISATKLADFRDLVLGVAKQIKAETTVADLTATHAQAVGLDAFCAKVDQMVGINLLPPGERLLLGSRIAQAAALQGMTLESDGAFHLFDEQGFSLLSLINHDTKPFQHHTLETASSTGLTLLLDVPRVQNPATQFDLMTQIAHELAQELQLNLVDDQRVLLSAGGLSRIREQIVAVETQMGEHDIAPGSAQARRLFA